MLGVLTGLKQEAKLISPFMPDIPIALSGAHPEGAKRALESLRRIGVDEILSFGCAGGLSGDVSPGTIIVADRVVVGGKTVPTDEALSHCFGAKRARRGALLHSDRLIETAQEKRRLYDVTKCLAVDMESGVLARAAMKFAVLRVVCDDAGRDLPPAARDGLRDGRIFLPGLAASVLKHPAQCGALITLGRDAARARKAMSLFLAGLFRK